MEHDKIKGYTHKEYKILPHLRDALLRDRSSVIIREAREFTTIR